MEPRKLLFIGDWYTAFIKQNELKLPFFCRFLVNQSIKIGFESNTKKIQNCETFLL